jgi:ribosome maturation factor RimP
MHEAVARVVAGLGYDLVEVERAGRGLLRVTIDRLPGKAYASGGEAVTVEDCELVTRQLQHALEVDGIDYARLEVSSPGLDRLLKREADFERFAGQAIDVTLKVPFQGRKHWKGVLSRSHDVNAGGWQLALGESDRALQFQLAEVREARLVPVIDFKGRGRKTEAAE